MPNYNLLVGWDSLGVCFEVKLGIKFFVICSWYMKNIFYIEYYIFLLIASSLGSLGEKGELFVNWVGGVEILQKNIYDFQFLKLELKNQFEQVQS